MTQTRETRPGPRLEADDTATVRLAAVALPLGVVLPLIATAIHPHRENGMDNPAVFAEYAHSSGWIAIHFAQWGGALLMFVGMLGVYHAVKTGSRLSRGIGRFALFVTVQAAAAITALQAVDGITLKWATEAWVAAHGDEKTAAFAAAEVVRWTELGFQSYSNVLLGLALLLFGGATAAGSSYPRWLGAVAAGSGVAWILHGAVVPYVGFFDSVPRLVGMALLLVWGSTMSVLMWRGTAQRRQAQPTPKAQHAMSA